MTQEEAFLQAILENPKDDTPRLVYADWLDERGIPHADTIRAHPELFPLVTGLRTAKSASVHVVGDALRARRLECLTTLVYLLERCCEHSAKTPYPQLPNWMPDDLDRLLARTPGRTFVRSILSVLRIWPHNAAATRKVASQLAGCQPQDVLLAALEQHGNEQVFFELWACTLQELVLRGAHLEGLSVVERFLKKLRGQNHPLGTLPLCLVEAEQGLSSFLPQYTSTSPQPTLFGPSQVPPGSPLPLPSARPLPVVSETSDPAATAAIHAAVQSWGGESQGRDEVRIFQAGSPLASHDVTVSLLQEMRLDCLAGAGDIRAKQTSLREVISLLFRAAANGGTDTRGLQGAHGRLAMWQSIAGLAGARPGEDIDTVARLAERCMWVYFDAASSWFHQLGWDLGVMALRPDGMSLAVLAASDEDLPIVELTMRNGDDPG
jgi:uncharacterized protein (TIGR02996 family)